jgi:hypothetical protein
MACWKLQFASMEDARKATLADRRRRPSVAKALDPYYCDDCKRFHIGHPPGTRRGQDKKEKALRLIENDDRYGPPDAL